MPLPSARAFLAIVSFPPPSFLPAASPGPWAHGPPASWGGCTGDMGGAAATLGRPSLLHRCLGGF